MPGRLRALLFGRVQQQGRALVVKGPMANVRRVTAPLLLVHIPPWRNPRFHIAPGKYMFFVYSLLKAFMRVRTKSHTSPRLLGIRDWTVCLLELNIAPHTVDDVLMPAARMQTDWQYSRIHIADSVALKSAPISSSRWYA